MRITQRRSQHSTDTVSEFHAEAPQATASGGLVRNIRRWCPILLIRSFNTT